MWCTCQVILLQIRKKKKTENMIIATLMFHMALSLHIDDFLSVKLLTEHG